MFPVDGWWINTLQSFIVDSSLLQNTCFLSFGPSLLLFFLSFFLPPLLPELAVFSVWTSFPVVTLGSLWQLYFVIFSGRGQIWELFLVISVNELNWSCRVNTSTLLHLLVWQRCGLLSSSCPLTGSGVPGLVPATKRDMFTKQAWTSRFLKIHTHNKRRFLEWKPTMRLLSAALCWSRKAAGFLIYYLIDGGLLWTDQIAGTRKNHSYCCYLFLFCRCKKLH